LLDLETDYQSLKSQAEKEDSLPPVVRRYLKEMDQLTELAKSRLEVLKVRISVCCFDIFRYLFHDFVRFLMMKFLF